jgi:hypothetical protein
MPHHTSICWQSVHWVCIMLPCMSVPSHMKTCFWGGTCYNCIWHVTAPDFPVGKYSYYQADGQQTTYKLRGVMYHLHNHFTSCFIAESGSVWYHDGMSTGQQMENEGNVVNMANLGTCQSQITTCNPPCSGELRSAMLKVTAHSNQSLYKWWRCLNDCVWYIYISNKIKRLFTGKVVDVVVNGCWHWSTKSCGHHCKTSRIWISAI